MRHLVSQSAFARRHGVTKQAVHAAIRRGEIDTVAGGWIDVGQAEGSRGARRAEARVRAELREELREKLTRAKCVIVAARPP